MSDWKASMQALTVESVQEPLVQAEAGGVVAVVPAEVDWGRQIGARWQDSVAAILDVGRMLVQAQLEVAHGRWEVFVDEQLPFGVRTAHRLMEIAMDERLTRQIEPARLPASWTTLYELTRLDYPTWTQAMESGEICPDMRKEDARRLRGPKRRRRANALQITLAWDAEGEVWYVKASTVPGLVTEGADLVEMGQRLQAAMAELANETA